MMKRKYSSLVTKMVVDFIKDHVTEISNYLDSLPKGGLDMIGKERRLHIDTEGYDCHQCNLNGDNCLCKGQEEIFVFFDHRLSMNIRVRDVFCIGVEDLRDLIQSVSEFEEASSDED